MALPPAPAPAGLMVKRLVKVPFVNMRVMFPREEGRKDVTFKMRRGASLRAELLRNRVEMPTCCEDMNCLCNCAVQVRNGAKLLEPPSTQEAQMIKKLKPYWRLTCRACVARDAADGSKLVIRMRPDLENVMRRKNPFGMETTRVTKVIIVHHPRYGKSSKSATALFMSACSSNARFAWWSLNLIMAGSSSS